MKQITQPSELTFSAISMQDAITMLPVVDSLAKERNRLIDAIYEAKANGADQSAYDSRRIIEKMNEVYKITSQLRILIKLGFCASDEALLQNPEDLGDQKASL